MLISSNNIPQCRAGLCRGPNVQFLVLMVLKHLWNPWNRPGGWVCLKLYNGPSQAFKSASVVFTHTGQTSLQATENRRSTAAQQALGRSSHIRLVAQAAPDALVLAGLQDGVAWSKSAPHGWKWPWVSGSHLWSVPSGQWSHRCVWTVFLQRGTKWVVTVKGWCENSLWFLGVMLCVWVGCLSPLTLIVLSELSHVTSHPDTCKLLSTFQMFYSLSCGSVVYWFVFQGSAFVSI